VRSGTPLNVSTPPANHDHGSDSQRTRNRKLEPGWVRWRMARHGPRPSGVLTGRRRPSWSGGRCLHRDGARSFGSWATSSVRGRSRWGRWRVVDVLLTARPIEGIPTTLLCRKPRNGGAIGFGILRPRRTSGYVAGIQPMKRMRCSYGSRGCVDG
jgi:hypothetical protein